MADLKKHKVRLEKLLVYLDYSVENGWLNASEFEDAGAHRFALRQAAEEMGVLGAFAWNAHTAKAALVVPLVYIATAENRSEAKKIHRKVWSQGLVPFLIILTPIEIIIRDGFQFSSDDWEESFSPISWDDTNFSVDDAEQPSTNGLWQIRASRLKTSLFWRDRAIEVSGRVDQCLLLGLESLSDALIVGTNRNKPLSTNAANGLIGRFLYVLFLVDRGIINQQWLDERGHQGIVVNDSSLDWSADATWALFKDLDNVFNGSIFPLSTRDREQIDATHINLIRMVMRHGARLNSHGEVQLSFIDVDLGVMRVETLSAVYEQFLENIKSGERRKQGAYYTPPFLVDLILDRVEETLTFQDGVTILDPSAGSGVFLVGAYRRILERARTQSLDRSMDLDEVRGLLQRNIFGIERNIDACHVAAFSLYLTMLDYVRPRDLIRVAAGEDSTKLFPSLVGVNLFAVDFFAASKAMPGLPKISCVVGNPPWQTLKKLESVPASKWMKQNPQSPIGNDQAAELFVWKALREHMDEGAFLALLIPAKSFVNPTAHKFRQALMAQYTVVGAINFAHLRHRLFAGAKHACAALFVSNREPAAADWVWVYSPLSVGQPMPYKAWPWTLIVDRSEVQQFSHARLAANSRSWFEAFMLRPVDRQIRSFVMDQAEAGHIKLLGELCALVGAAVKRGGSSVETGLDVTYIKSTSSNAPDGQVAKGITKDLFDEVSVKKRASDRLPLAQLEVVSQTYKYQFSGNILLVPRNFFDVRFIEYPIAFSSSFLAVFFQKTGKLTTLYERKFLHALRKYFSSNLAMYFVATGGRRWLMDRRNVEPSDMEKFPVPFSRLDDPRIEVILELEGEKLEAFLIEAMGIASDYRLAINEFLKFRLQFQDGDVPPNALDRPTAAMVKKYAAVLKKQLGGLMDRSNAFAVTHSLDTQQGVGVITAKFTEAGEMPSDENTDLLCATALSNYRKSTANSFTDGLSISYDDSNAAVSVVKPLEYFRWTIDSAFADSRQVMDTFVKGAV